MRLRSILTFSAVLAAGSALMAAPAHAAVAAPQDRVECTRLSNGQLCMSLNTGPERVQVFYTKSGGSTIRANLGYRTSTGTTKWGPDKTISVGERALTQWEFNYSCSPDYKGLIKVDGQGTFETPWATC
jgi:hypothetical protein